MANLFGGFQSGLSPPNIPAGLTIERKKPGKSDHDHHRTSSPVVDKVEITKVPVSSNGVSQQREFSSKNLSTSSAGTSADAPLNLSLKTSMTTNSKDAFQSPSMSLSKIPSEYYACKLKTNLIDYLRCYSNGATTLSTMTISIMTLYITVTKCDTT